LAQGLLSNFPQEKEIPIKMKITPKNKLAVLCTAFCAVLLAFSHNAGATAFTIGDSHELGFVQYGIPSGDTDRQTYINHLIGMAPGSANTADGQDYTRSSNIFSPLDPAVLTGLVNGTGTTVDLGSGYLYLFAKYDGPNYGSEVWYVGGFTGTITIPSTAGGYGLSGWTLFNASPGQGVPDGGTTVMLLGAALGALGVARRFIMS
jgi:hypothetical protein